MSLDISFDHDWSCCHYVTPDGDDMATLVITNVADDLDWFLVDLPHIAPVKKESTIDNKLDKWWYRKQFQCILSDQQLTQSVCLTFRSSGNDTRVIDNSSTSPVSVVVWLNAVKIFSGSLSVPHISMELPEILLKSNQVNNYNHTHTLIVCCINTCLSFNAFLTLPHDVVCSVRTVQFNATTENTANLTQKDNNTYGIDERVTTTSDSKLLFPASTHGISEVLGNVSSKTTDEVSSEENIQANNHVPLLTIVILVVGTRGDVQPFIAYGKALRAAGHRVRLATHEKFRKFVREHGLEFFPLGGDPNEIMSFMVKNSGIFPSFSTIIKGNLLKRRHIFAEILESTWLACTSDDDESSAPFRAEVIIANPLSYGHVHCAQKLGIPLHMVFTMPSTPTTAFPHPLSTIDYSKAPRERLNMFSYNLVETLMWLGIGDLINKFRHTTLGLPSLHIRHATSVMVDEKVPYTYCWSPSLVPKPPDWPFYVDVSGYFFLDLATSYTTPPNDLLTFLGLNSTSNNPIDEISRPIFIGFGSITGHDSHRLLNVILDALMQTGYRALLSGFDIDADHLPDTIFKIDDIPYDWLFQHVSAVCHHGGAGTTAAGLRAGKPNITVPFFGDQFFWGNVVSKSGAGPPPLPGKDVTVKELVEAFKFVHKPTVQNAAKRIQEAILHEDGCAAAVRAFHANLPLSRMRSDLEPTFAACFRLDEFNLQVSRPVAQVLLSTGLVDESQFRYHSTRDWQLTHNSKSESDIHNHPSITDFHLHTTTVRLSVNHSLKNGTNSSMNKSYAGCSRRRTSGSSIGALVANVNSMVKPVIGTLLSFNGLIGNRYTDGKTSLSKNTDVSEQIAVMSDQSLSSLSTSNDDTHQNDPNDISVLARNAASISGFTPDVCKNILLEFTKLKRRVQTPTLSLMKHQQPQSFTLRRSQSFADN